MRRNALAGQTAMHKQGHWESTRKEIGWNQHAKQLDGMTNETMSNTKQIPKPKTPYLEHFQARTVERHHHTKQPLEMTPPDIDVYVILFDLTQQLPEHMNPPKIDKRKQHHQTMTNKLT
eukprot:5071570-Amphidinium_carterae.1